MSAPETYFWSVDELRGLCTGVGWHDDRLQLELRSGDEKPQWPLEPGQLLSLKLPNERRCIGYRPPGASSLLPCPDQVQGIGSSQCEPCFLRAKILPCLRCDGERCRNPHRRSACVQPANHALYLCSFGPGAIKVGVAAWERRRERVSEQGARAGIIVGRDDGQMIRRYEQMIRRSGIPDRLQPTVKLVHLSQPSESVDLVGELTRQADRLRQRLPIPWLDEYEELELEAINYSGPTPQLLEPHAGMAVRGPILARAGNLLIIDSDRDECVALEASSLTGYEIEPLREGEVTSGQMALGV